MASLVSLACSTERSLRLTAVVVVVVVAWLAAAVATGVEDVVGEGVGELLEDLFFTTLPSYDHQQVTSRDATR